MALRKRYLIGACLLAEVMARLLARTKPELTSHSSLFCEFDPILGWKKIAYGNGTHITSEYQVFERFNSSGLREREIPIAKRDGEYRILFLGDSFTEGYSVATHQVFSRRLEVRLNQDHSETSYRCINAGTGGYGTDQELLFFDLEGKSYQPDLTVLMFFQNDLLENVSTKTPRGYEKPRFAVSAGKLVLNHAPQPGPPQPRRTLLTRMTSNIVGCSSALSLVRASAQKVGSRYRFMIPKFLGAVKKNPIPNNLGVWANSGFPEVDDAWTVTHALIARLRDDVVTRGGAFMVFYVPHEIEVYSELWQFTRKFWNLPENGWSRRQVVSRLQAFCDENNIICIDPTREFCKEAASPQANVRGGRLYYPIDGHWTPRGHSIAARILEETIKTLFVSGAN